MPAAGAAAGAAAGGCRAPPPARPARPAWPACCGVIPSPRALPVPLPSHLPAQGADELLMSGTALEEDFGDREHMPERRDDYNFTDVSRVLSTPIRRVPPSPAGCVPSWIDSPWGTQICLDAWPAAASGLKRSGSGGSSIARRHCFLLACALPRPPTAGATPTRRPPSTAPASTSGAVRCSSWRPTAAAAAPAARAPTGDGEASSGPASTASRRSRALWRPCLRRRLSHRSRALSSSSSLQRAEGQQQGPMWGASTTQTSTPWPKVSWPCISQGI